MASYGTYKYESPEMRALKSITVESYDKDEQKTLSKLKSDVSMLAGFSRKLQQGVDSANENVIQQLQGFVNNIIVLLGGGSAQGFDFGDLRYVFQLIGSIFGFNTAGGIAALLPLNAFEAIWHALSTFIFPSGVWKDVINNLIDGFIGTILDMFGEIPIVGEAIEQFAEIVLLVRDGFWDIGARFDAFIHNITDGLGEGIDFLAHILTKVFNQFIQPIIDFISRAVGGPVGRAIDTILTNIAKIFGLASGADSKATALLKQAKPLWDSVDGQGETSLNISAANVLLVINQTTSRGAFIPCLMGETKQTISCIVSKTGTVTTFNLDVYSLNDANGLDWIYSSPDLSSGLTAGTGNETVLFHELLDDDKFATTQNKYYLVVARMTGGGSVNIQGMQYPTANTPQRPLYPGLVRNPSVGGAAPTNIVGATVDGLYTRDTPYFQLGTLAGISPQSFYADFSAFSNNLWIKGKRATGFGGINTMSARGPGILDVTSNGNAGRNWGTHRFHVATNRCRFGVRFYEGFAPNSRSTVVTLFSRLDKPSGIGLRFLNDGADTCYLVIMNGDGSITNYTVPGKSLQLLAGSPGVFTGSWIYFEYDPSDSHFRAYLNPDWDSPLLRVPSTSPGGMMFLDFDEALVPDVAAWVKSSISRSSSILMACAAGGPAALDDWILEDYAEPV